MLTPVRLTETLTVSSQIDPAGMHEIAHMGFKTVINNRPDGEAPDQPCNAEIEQAARALGLDYFYIPVVSGAVTSAQSRAFARILQEAPAPVLAFCRTGTRCSALWVMGSHELGSFGARIRRAAEMGYDLNWVADICSDHPAN